MTAPAFNAALSLKQPTHAKQLAAMLADKLYQEQTEREPK